MGSSDRSLIGGGLGCVVLLFGVFLLAAVCGAEPGAGRVREIGTWAFFFVLAVGGLLVMVWDRRRR